MVPITNSGTSVCAAISPDGKSVAHVEKKDGMQQVIVTDLATKEKTVIVTPEKVEYRGVTFSPDGIISISRVGALTRVILARFIKWPRRAAR